MRRTRAGRTLVGAVLAGSLAGTAALGADALPPGQLIEHVACRDSADQSYALYLPSGYTPERSWPILYALDPRESGPRAVQVFQEAAERFGWIVAGSNNSISDTADAHERNLAAMGALWRDSHTRLSIDPSRVYATGMSGGARAACFLADTAPGTIAGVIACAAGFAPGRPPHKGLSFVVFGTVGNLDFNYAEMQDLDTTLDGLDVPHRIATFDGPHGWPPPQLASEAVAWMELHAMSQGRRAKDPQLVDTLYAAAVERARAHQSDGRLVEAGKAWRDVAASFGPLRDVAEATAALARLHDSKAYAKAVKARERALRDEQEAEQKAARSFASIPREQAAASLGRLLRALDVSQLKKDAQASEPEKSLSAQRRLTTLFTQLSFYLPTELKSRGDYPRALLAVRAAAEIRPESPRPWLARARIRAAEGDGDDAEQSLREAVDRLEAAIASASATDRIDTLVYWRKLIAQDDELAPLRDRPGFQALLDRLTPPAT